MRNSKWIVMVIMVNTLLLLLLSGCGLGKADAKPIKNKHSSQSAELYKKKSDAVIPSDTEPTAAPAYLMKLKKRTSDVNAWKKKKGGYKYPVTSADMANLDTEEDRFSVCQIPTEIVENINSEDLLKLVLDCPMLSYMKYWDSMYDGIYEVKNNFNGMEELLSRPDAYKTIVNYYKQMKIPKTKKNNINNMANYDEAAIIQDEALMKKLDDDMQIVNTILFCETVMVCMTDHVDGDLLREAKTVLKEKTTKVKHTEFYDNIKTERWQIRESPHADKRMLIE